MKIIYLSLLVIFLVICILYYEYFNIVQKIQEKNIEKFVSTEGGGIQDNQIKEAIDNINSGVESITSTLCENKKTYDLTNIDIVSKFDKLLGDINKNYEYINENLNDYHSTLISSKNTYTRQQ